MRPIFIPALDKYKYETSRWQIICYGAKLVWKFKRTHRNRGKRDNVVVKLGGKQKWRTKSGKKSSETGERYLPSAAIAALSDAEYRYNQSQTRG